MAWIIGSILSRKRDGGNLPGAPWTGHPGPIGVHFLRISARPAWQWSCFLTGSRGNGAMKWTRTSVVVVVAGLLLGLPALVAAQRPSEGVGGGGGGGAASSRGGESGGGGGASGGSTSPGASGPIAGPGGYSTPTGSSGPGGGSSWGGSSNPSTPGWGGTNAIRPRDEVVSASGIRGRDRHQPGHGAQLLHAARDAVVLAAARRRAGVGQRDPAQRLYRLASARIGRGRRQSGLGRRLSRLRLSVLPRVRPRVRVRRLVRIRRLVHVSGHVGLLRLRVP